MISESKRKIAALALAGAMAIGGAAGVATTIASPAQNQSGIVMEAEAADNERNQYSQKFLEKDGLYCGQSKTYTFPEKYTLTKAEATKLKWSFGKDVVFTRTNVIRRADKNDGKAVTDPAVIGVSSKDMTSITFTGNRDTTYDGSATFKYEVMYTYKSGGTTYYLNRHYNQILYSSKMYVKFSKSEVTVKKGSTATIYFVPQTAGGHKIAALPQKPYDVAITTNSGIAKATTAGNTVTVKGVAVGTTNLKIFDKSYGKYRTVKVTVTK